MTAHEKAMMLLFGAYDYHTDQEGPWCLGRTRGSWITTPQLVDVIEKLAELEQRKAHS